jgi:hypothetical protein
MSGLMTTSPRNKKKDVLHEMLEPFLGSVLLKDFQRLSARPWEGSDVNRYPYEANRAELDATSIPPRLVFGIRLVQM